MPPYQQQIRFGPQLTRGVKLLLTLNVALFLIIGVVFEEMLGKPLAFWFYQTFGLVPQEVLHSFKIWQLLTYAFLHSELGHIFWNMITLWMFGCEIEGLWGRRPFILFYLLCAAGGGLAVVATQNGLTIGASGATIGLVVAYGVQFADRPISLLFPPVTLKAKWLAIGWIALDLIYFLKGQGSGIAYFAHFGGALTAYLYMKLPWKFSMRSSLHLPKFSIHDRLRRYRTRRYLKLVDKREQESEKKGPTFH